MKEEEERDAEEEDDAAGAAATFFFFLLFFFFFAAAACARSTALELFSRLPRANPQILLLQAIGVRHDRRCDKLSQLAH